MLPAGQSGTITFSVTLGPGSGVLILSAAPLQTALQKTFPGITLMLSDAANPVPSSQLDISQSSTALTPQTVVVTLTVTTAGLTFPDRRYELPPVGPFRWLPISLIAMILLFSLWISLGATEKPRARAAWAFLALVVLCEGWMAGCSSNSPSTSSATPAGSYTIAITGKLGNVTQTIDVTLNVTQ